MQELRDNAQALVAPGKGILAADESTGTIKKRFDSINAKSTEETRLNYREMLFRTEGAAEFISGVILYDETLRQNSAIDGTPLVKVLQDQGIIPGIKVDKSTNPLSGSSGELITDGLDGLRDRLAEYYELGAKPILHRGQRASVGPIRRPEPGGQSGSHRRARSSDGRRPQHRPVLRGHGVDPA